MIVVVTTNRLLTSTVGQLAIGQTVAIVGETSLSGAVIGGVEAASAPTANLSVIADAPSLALNRVGIQKKRPSPNRAIHAARLNCLPRGRIAAGAKLDSRGTATLSLP
jgi:hypothetical protein